MQEYGVNKNKRSVKKQKKLEKEKNNDNFMERKATKKEKKNIFEI